MIDASNTDTGTFDLPQLRADRLQLVDIAKGLGILFVVLGHNQIFAMGEATRSYNEMLGTFRMPFFFFISGVIFPVARSLPSLMIQRADAWLKPFAVVVICLGLFRLATDSGTLEGLLVSLMYGTGFTLIWMPLWFLPHLWLLYLFSTYVMQRGGAHLKAPWMQLMLLGVLGVAGHFILRCFDNAHENSFCRRPAQEFSMDLLNCGLPFSADFLLLSSMYFLSGHFLVAAVKSYRFSAIAFLLSLALFFCLYFLFHQHIDFTYRNYGNLAIATVQAGAAIYAMLGICHFMTKSKFLSATLAYVGTASLFILIFHFPIQNEISAAVERISDNAFYAGSAGFVAAVMAPIAFWEACKRNRFLSRVMLPLRRKNSGRQDVSVPHTV